MKGLFSLIGVELSEVSYKEKALSAVGGMVAIGLLIWVTHRVVDQSLVVCVIASMGASAVLLFAVPHGQLSQPWPVLAGHGLSAAIGVLCARYLGPGWISAGCAVGLAIAVMHQLKCIHPPGGATALTAVVGGDAVQALGFQYVLWPVLINAVIVLGVAVIFNWPFAWRRYPAVLANRGRLFRPHPSGKERAHEDIVKALQQLDSFVDITESDLVALARITAREREARLLKEARKKTADTLPTKG